MDLTREQFKNWLIIFMERSGDGRNIAEVETMLLAHDASLRTRLEGVERERDSLVEQLCEAATKHLANRSQLATSQARVKELEGENTEKRFNLLLSYRGIDKPCEGCGGMGTKAYGSTATWRHGIGGQSVTTDVCDKCWGSGDHDKPWRSWKQRDTLTSRCTRLEEALKRLISCFEEDTPHLAEIDGDHSYHLTGMPHESLTLARQALTPAAGKVPHE